MQSPSKSLISFHVHRELCELNVLPGQVGTNSVNLFFRKCLLQKSCNEVVIDLLIDCSTHTQNSKIQAL